MVSKLEVDGKVVRTGGRPKGTPRTGGRKKGTPNRLTSDVRGMVLAALDGAGGLRYLIRQAEENPTAFLTLVGRTLPREIQATIQQAPSRDEVDAMIKSIGLQPEQIWAALH